MSCYQLTKREVEALQALADHGHEYLAAESLGISHNTLHRKLHIIRLKMQARNTTHAVVMAWTRGWIR